MLTQRWREAGPGGPEGGQGRGTRGGGSAALRVAGLKLRFPVLGGGGQGWRTLGCCSRSFTSGFCGRPGSLAQEA